MAAWLSMWLKTSVSRDQKWRAGMLLLMGVNCLCEDPPAQRVCDREIELCSAPSIDPADYNPDACPEPIT